MRASTNDTIAAIATPPGIGGVGIVRLSGPEALGIALRMFRRPAPIRGVGHRADAPTPPADEDIGATPHLLTGTVAGATPSAPRVGGVADATQPALDGWWPESHRLYYGQAIQPSTGQPLDEVLLAYMRGPHSYTAEDVVEFQGHGGPLVLRRILDASLGLGARLANPGEMTLRAFLNGRIDLVQAEAVMDLIGARTDEGLHLAVGQLQGRLSIQVRTARDEVLGVLAQIEASIDFPEEEVPTPQPDDLRPGLAAAAERLAHLLAGAEAGRIYREGLRAAIIGRPNVGKSSLLNVLLRSERAIVTPIAGTTRDTVEEFANVRGIPVQLIDTAGITDSRDPVEQIGVRRSRQAAASADLLLLVLDSSEPLTDQDEAVQAEVRTQSAGGRPLILVLNKSDLPLRIHPAELTARWPDAPLVSTSTLTQHGLEELEEQILTLALAGQATPAAAGETLVANTRHRDALRRAAEHLAAANETLDHGLPLDFVAIDLHAALAALGEITGETATEDLLERIFHDFCIGK